MKSYIYKLLTPYYLWKDKENKIKKLAAKRKINVGSGNISIGEDWVSCDINTLDITKASDWIKFLKKAKSVDNIFAEHVWEHLSASDRELANTNCFTNLSKNGRLRIAVPDGYHISKEYIEQVKPNGTGAGSDDHKVLFNYKTLGMELENAGFTVERLEYWDEFGKFQEQRWDIKHGKVSRSKQYDHRNVDESLVYTSLILDAIKK